MSAHSTSFVLTLTCPDQPGIVSRVSTFIAENGGNIVDSAQFGDKETQRFCMRLHVVFEGETVDGDVLRAGFAEIAKTYNMQWGLYDSEKPARVLIMVSRYDHCL
ncbi:MAG: ACT domain-containing protein, partial [Pseudomonadota bacterium]